MGLRRNRIRFNIILAPVKARRLIEAADRQIILNKLSFSLIIARVTDMGRKMIRTRSLLHSPRSTLSRWRSKAEIIVLLATARLLIKFVSFRWWRGMIVFGYELDRKETAVSQAEIVHAIRIGKLISQIADRMPFRAVCLPQAMTGRWILKRRGVRSRIMMGARKGRSDKPIELHAWLMVEDRCITGDRNRQSFMAFEHQVVESK